MASDGNPQDEYGYAVAISGDTIMVGAYNDDDNGRSSGSAHVYTREAGGAWIERAKLLAGDGAVDSYFGASLAVSDDTALIGAFLDDDRGAAYVFTRDVGGVG